MWKKILLTTTSLVLSGCIFAPELNDPADPASSAATPVSYLPGGQKKTKSAIADGLKSMRYEDYDRASGYFNKAVAADPGSADAQFLNGLAYHMRALSGDSDLFEYAEVGYKMAAKINSGHKLALQQLGRLYMQLRRFRDAQDQFARGLLADPDNPEMLTGLAMASYLAQDLQTAYAALERAEETIPADPMVIRLQCLVHAAMGRMEIAQKHFENLKKITTDKKITTQIASRLEEWKKFYRFNGIGVIRNALQTQRAEFEMESKKPSELADQATGASQRMTFVEVTFIRAETTEETTAGANLVKTLQFFAGSNDVGGIGTQAIELNDRLQGFKSILKNNVTMGQLKYVINVGNSNSSRFDILSRPTLIAIDRNTATFFSGSDLDVVTVGSLGGTGTSTTKKIGINLEITPFFYNDSRLKLNIVVNNASFQPRNANVQVGSSSTSYQTSNDVLKTNVIMDLGKTLILSGLNTRSGNRTNNGVPRLKNMPIPFGGLLFGDRSSTQTNQSTIILITPHPQEVAKTDRSGQVRDPLFLTQQIRQKRLEELRVRYDSQFALPTDVNMEIINGLMLEQFNREFRITDVMDLGADPQDEVKFIMSRLVV